ncbi:MAG TPA: TonB-dependent receptor [Xanthobacteraceae bacterium]
MFPVKNRGRDRGRLSAFRSLFISTSVIALVALANASPGAAQTTPTPPPPTEATPKKGLPQISVSGKRLEKRKSKNTQPAIATPAPNVERAPPVPPAPGIAGNVATPSAGVPVTPLNTIALTASRLGLPVIEMPASVDIVTAQTIADQGYRTTTDIARGAVGVLAGDAGGAPANFSMRGFVGNEVNTLYNGISTGPSDITNRWMGTANLEQVEILKGPSSLMTGLNAIGGTVNYVNRQPTSGPVQSEADVSFDSFGSVLSHYGSGGNTGLQGLDYRFDASGSKLNSFIDGDFRDLTDISGQLNYHVTRNFMVWGAVDYKADSGHAYWGTPLVPTSFAGSNAVSGVVSGSMINTFSGSPIGPVTIDSRTLTTNYNVADNATSAHELWLRTGFEWTPLNNVTIKNQLYSWQTKANWIDSETYAFDDGSVFAPGMIDRDRFFVDHDQKLIGDNTDFTWDSNVFGMDNRLAAQLQMSRNWIQFTEQGFLPSGYPYPADAVTVVDPSPGVYGPEVADIRDSRLTDIAGSFEDRLKITSAFALIGGIRFEDLILDRSGSDFDGTIDPIPFTQTWRPVSYRAAYTYEPIPDLMFYSMYATAYDPAVAGVFSLAPDPASGNSLKLTSSELYETGAKQLFWNDRAEWTIAAYSIAQQNVLVPTSPVTDDVAGEVKTKGIEVSAAVSPIDGLKLWGNAAFTHARFTNFDVWTGNTPPDVAPVIINGGASYRFNHWRWPVEFGGSVRHVGVRDLDQTNLTIMDSYTTADIYSFVDIPGKDLWMPQFKHVRLTFRVRNLTNVVYAQWSDSGLPDQVLLGAPRTYEVGASAKW